MKRLLILFLIVWAIIGCKQKSHSVATNKSGFKDSLIEKQISHSHYYISLPPGYNLKEHDGPDFTVYYITTQNHILKEQFSEGLYFGNFPGMFPKSDSCQAKTIKGAILGKVEQWSVYDCAGNYFLQVVAQSQSGEEWCSIVHAFGEANSKMNMYRLLEIFSTLKRKK
jgi:hypothetical protein